ncbi:metal-dependent hydrolase [Alteromonas gilva]|uniref:Metal-dependent hydrolase n=1 Tax=Alteromonas gilva TaxID=2987522 RepID=A0ABT5L7C8_9ALTE|nr:metal-dependent hydrolase [Alteromonas gilva]MDC8832970.1 metal-dependent hydrolase [Alteromonas gilva]
MMIAGHMIVAASAFVSYVHWATGGAWQADTSFALTWGLVMLGVLLPDIDHPDSTIGRRCRWLSYPIHIVFGHRGFTHSLLACALIVLLAYQFEALWIYWVAVGYFLHLLGDFLTPSGVTLFYPSRKTYRAWLVADTNSIGEWVLSLGIASASLTYVIGF